MARDKDTKDKDIFNVFFREKPALMLLGLRDPKGQMYASALAKEIDCTYSHVVKVIQEMNSAGLVSFKKQGRLKLLSLTNKGQKVADHIDSIKDVL